MQPERPRRPDLLSIYVSTIVLLGAGALTAYAIDVTDEPFGPRPLLFAAFALLLTLTELRPMLFLSDGGEATASWTFALAMLFVAPPLAPLVVVAIAAVLSDFRGNKDPQRIAFNAGQFILSLSAGIVAGSWIEDLTSITREPVDPRWLLAAFVTGLVAFAMNTLLIVVVLSLHTTMPMRDILRRSIDAHLGMDGLLLALAPVFVIIGQSAPILLPMLLITVGAIFNSATLALKNRHEATHDQLTGVPNRRLFEDHATMLLKSAATGGHRAALLTIDLDGFKEVNDQLGHDIGDEVLCEAARRLRDQRRPSDVVARMGGDEFVILLGQVESSLEARTVAKGVRDVLEEQIMVDGLPLRIGASVGVAMFPGHGDDLHTLMRASDTAMYHAKSAGGQVALPPVVEEAPMRGRLSLVSALGDAIPDQLSLEYQPVIHMATGSVRSVEALLRWEHPELGPLKPEWYMPQAEQTDLVTPLTDTVIDLALGQCREWYDDGLYVGMAINVSARTLHDNNFPKRLAAAMDHHRVDPCWITMEITENSVLADPARSATVLTHLRDLGVAVAMDDFGTGYSSLANLQKLTIDRIKIDKSFVTHLGDRPGDLAIVRSVIDLGRNLGLTTVAEGVETLAVLRVLQSLGVDEYQGYLAARPGTAEVIAPLLRNGVIDLINSDPVAPLDVEPVR